MPDQFSNEYNQLAHYEGTAVEILEQTRGEVDYFVSSLGTSGTLMGVGMALKERLPSVKIVSAHPVRGHYIQGLKNLEEAIVPAIYDASKIDRHVMVESEDAFELARRVALEEGIFAGMSSGAALWASLLLAAEVLYVQPLFLQAEQTAIPELTRVIVVYADKVAMERTLEAALLSVFGQEQAQPSGETTQAGTGGSSASATAAQAQRLYQQAIDAQRRGVWAAYGKLIKQLGDVIDRLSSQATTKAP
jgi:hypothetical protein